MLTTYPLDLLRSTSIDLVTSVGTLHHLKNPEKFFKECIYVSRGMCIVHEFSYDVSLRGIGEFMNALGVKVPKQLIKLIAVPHGIPRREFYGRNST